MRILHALALDYLIIAKSSPTWIPGSGSFSCCTRPEFCKDESGNVKRVLKRFSTNSTGAPHEPDALTELYGAVRPVERNYLSDIERCALGE